MLSAQPGILAPIPTNARHLFFSISPNENVTKAVQTLGDSLAAKDVVLGIGSSLALAVGAKIPGLRNFPNYQAGGIDLPSTPYALWIWLRGVDRGDLVHQTLQLQKALTPAFNLEKCIDAFEYQDSRDLTGYEDGTENPVGDDAMNAAIVQNSTSPNLNGSSFVAIQQWVHDLAGFQAMSAERRDHTIGRRIRDNAEIEEAPESAHVKRTAQESFSPEAFILRRSMPWANAENAGLVFVAFGKSFDAFEALLQRMMGMEDGVRDALFDFTKPVTGSYFWCPPMENGKLDFSTLTAVS